MRLRSLEIQGFKSFPDRTCLNFIDGITAVVGPNGSGKSNIADAVRWVLGEQSSKTLRGGKMEDVIFGGTQTRKPKGFAYVQITIDNADRALHYDHNEVSVSRKLYRSGESEYKINRVSVRLKDIYELFMDTGLGRDGYSIIGQGKISEIVSAKNTQRREIFEEAAGISKFRYRKAEAERRLQTAEDNLLRLRDILSELQSRVEPLRIQSEKASKFLEIESEKKILEISLWVSTLEKSKIILREQEDKILICKSEHNDIQQKLDEFELQIGKTYSIMQNISVEIENSRTQIKEIEIKSSHNIADIAVMKNDLLHNEGSIDRIRNELKNSDISENQLNKKIDTYINAINQKEQELLSIREQYEQLQKSLFNQGEQKKVVDTEIDLISKKQVVISQQLNEKKLVSVSDNSHKEELIVRLNELKVNADLKQQNLINIETDISNCKEFLCKLQQKIETLQNEKKGYQIKLTNFQTKIQDLTLKRNKMLNEVSKNNQKANLLLNMENSLEGFHNSVKHVMSQVKKGVLTGVFGPVSRLIEVSTEHALSIEIALGGSLQNIVVQNESVAKSAIKMLKDAKLGRATFLPISCVKGKSIDKNVLVDFNGFVGIASDLVQSDEKFRGIISQLLGRIVVVQDLDYAIQMAKKVNYRYRIVTLDGQVINSGGSMTGGYIPRTAGILGRSKQIKQLKQNAKILEKEAFSIQTEIKIVQEKSSSVKGCMLGVEDELTAIQEDKIKCSAELSQLNSAYSSAVESNKLALKERNKLTLRIKDLQEKNSSNVDIINDLESQFQESQTQLAQIEEKESKLAKQIAKSTEGISTFKIKLATYDQEIQAITQIKDQVTAQKNDHKEHTEWLHSQIQKYIAQSKQITVNIQQSDLKKQQYEKQIIELNDKIKILNEKRIESEGHATKIRANEKIITNQRETTAKELSRLEEKKRTLQVDYDAIISRLWDEYEVTRTQAMQVAISIKDENTAQRRLRELKAEIKSLGNVNLSAIEEFKEVSERYQFLKAQIEDVETSKAELNEMILELTDDMQKIFTSSFEKISAYFSHIFTVLFDGGKASLTLTDPLNILETGIEIYVQPPGKIIKNLSALSGGEQAFVAIAIYFAILKFRPSPFCMLDEIEAALDDVNVVKYAHYLRTICQKTQFIIITHRRGTMEEADILYGVTMQEEGISKLLELNVNQIESKLGIK